MLAYIKHVFTLLTKIVVFTGPRSWPVQGILFKTTEGLL